MKKRVAYFKINGKTIGANSTANVSFDITYFGNTLVPLESRFNIDNLNKDDMYYITTNTALFQGRERKIEFYCGYEGDVKKLFDGRISKATPSGQPDTSLSIIAWSSLESMGKQVKIKRNNITYLKLLEDAVKECGLGLDCPNELRNSGRLQTIVDNFSITDSAYKYLSRVIMDITGCDMVKDQLLFAVEKGKLKVSSENGVNVAPIIEINSKTGMVGIPQPTNAGVEVRVILNTNLHAGQTINLKSKIMPAYNGKYNIVAVTHHGSSRSDEWYTDLTCSIVYGETYGSTNI